MPAFAVHLAIAALSAEVGNFGVSLWKPVGKLEDIDMLDIHQ
jgi:hypothetical protein